MLSRILLLVAASLVGAVLPLRPGLSQRWLHRFVALASGLFLGMLFLHLLPEALSVEAGGLSAATKGALVLGGALAILLVQQLALPGRGGHDPHVSLSWGSFLGLSVHALATGLALGAVEGEPLLSGGLLLSLVGHKLAEGFSLSTLFSLLGLSRVRTVALIALFSAATPLGLVLGTTLAHGLRDTGTQALEAIAAGTFLFVALGDLLPEVFHGREDVARRVQLLVLGIVVAGALHATAG